MVDQHKANSLVAGAKPHGRFSEGWGAEKPLHMAHIAFRGGGDRQVSG
jgi:hypothetical protein